MTPTKNQITEVTEMAQQMNVDANAALCSLSACSPSIFKVIGAKGVVESAAKTIERSQGVCLMSDCSIEKETEKAILVFYVVTNTRFWVPKSQIINDTFPIWIAQKN
jgi:hypothetical protein